MKEHLVVFAYENFDGSTGFGNNTIEMVKKAKITKKTIKDIEKAIKGDNSQIRKAVLINLIELKVEK